MIRQWLAALQVETLFIEPGSPWENGYVESFNGKLRDELLDREIFYTLTEAKILIERWRREYNTVRPHSGVGLSAAGSGSHQPSATERTDHEPSSLIRTGSTLGGRSGICAAYVHVHGGAGVRARFLNKSPMNTLRIDVLQRLFPDACFVSLVRDPRAVVRSWAEKNIPKLSNHPRSSVRTEEGRQVLTVDGQPYERPHFLSRLCESYVYVVNTQLRRMKAVPPERKYEARYEEFVADIHGTLRRLDEHFGLDSALRRWTDIPRRQRTATANSGVSLMMWT